MASILKRSFSILEVFKEVVSYLNENKTKFLELDKENVLLLLIDGLTVNQARRIAKNFYIIRSLDIPSTAPVITSINLLKYPGEHGAYAWYIYSELFRELIEPLPYFSEEGKINTKYHLFLEEFETIYQKINCKSYVFIPNEYADSAYSRAIYKGSERIGYRALSEIVVKVKELSKEKERKFIYIYYPKLDILSHMYGPSSKYSSEELRIVKYLIKRLQRTIEDTNVIITADHGFVKLNKRKQVKIDKIDKYSEFVAGEQRNVFIKPKDGSEDKILEYLEKNLKKKKIDYILKILDKREIEKLLGKYTERVKHLEGCIFLQMKDDGFVKRYDTTFVSDHGGASKEELEIPLIIF